MKTILKTKTTDEQRQEFDEIKDVITTLRNLCQNIKNANQAVNHIAKKTGLSKTRVKEILRTVNH